LSIPHEASTGNDRVYFMRMDGDKLTIKLPDVTSDDRLVERGRD
jgi:hypothetical protein